MAEADPEGGHYLTKVEVDALEGAAATARDGVIIRTFNETGMRLGELLGLAIEDVCKSPTGPHLRVTGTKTRSERHVPIRPPLHLLLNDYIDRKRPKGCPSPSGHPRSGGRVGRRRFILST